MLSKVKILENKQDRLTIKTYCLTPVIYHTLTYIMYDQNSH